MGGSTTTFENVLVRVPEVKTTVLHLLTPIQSLNLMSTYSGLFVTVEWKKYGYASLFRYIIGDWRWFEHKIADCEATIRYLLDKGTDASIQGKNGDTVLHQLATNLSTLLLQHTRDVEV